MTGRKVDHEVRTDEVVLSKKDSIAHNISYFGRTEIINAADSDPVWQIKRVSSVSGDEVTEYADFGKYNLKWSDRFTYFSPDPAPEIPPPLGTFITSGEVETATGTPLLKTSLLQTVQSGSVQAVNAVVPVGKHWRLRGVHTNCRAYGAYTVKINGTIVGKGLTGPHKDESQFRWTPYAIAVAGQAVTVDFDQSAGPALDLSVFLSLTEH